MINRIQLNICYLVIAILSGLLAWSGIKNYQHSNTIDQQADVITQKLADNANLKAYVDLQNTEVEQLGQQSFEANLRAAAAEAKSLPIVEEEERRILGVRSAPKAQSAEDIRQKMLRDAML